MFKSYFRIIYLSTVGEPNKSFSGGEVAEATPSQGIEIMLVTFPASPPVV